MPYYSFKELWTPLKPIGILFFKESSEGTIWIKIWGGHCEDVTRNRHEMLDAECGKG